MNRLLKRLVWNTLTRRHVLAFFRFVLPIRKGRVVCVCWGGAKYGCNPKAITDYITDNNISKLMLLLILFCFTINCLKSFYL